MLRMALRSGDGPWAASLLNKGAKMEKESMVDAIYSGDMGIVALLRRAGGVFDEEAALALLFSNQSRKPKGLIDSIMRVTRDVSFSPASAAKAIFFIDEDGWKKSFSKEIIKKAGKDGATAALLSVCGMERKRRPPVLMRERIRREAEAIKFLAEAGANLEVESGKKEKETPLENSLAGAASLRSQRCACEIYLGRAMALLANGAKRKTRPFNESKGTVYFDGGREGSSFDELIKLSERYALAEVLVFLDEKR